MEQGFFGRQRAATGPTRKQVMPAVASALPQVAALSALAVHLTDEARAAEFRRVLGESGDEFQSVIETVERGSGAGDAPAVSSRFRHAVDMALDAARMLPTLPGAPVAPIVAVLNATRRMID